MWFRCGPLEVAVIVPDPIVRAKIIDALTLYNVRWPPRRAVTIEMTDPHPQFSPTRGEEAERAHGSYLTCARMRVDATADGLYATSASGAACSVGADSDHWSIAVPPLFDEWVLGDIEELVGLVLTTSWRRLGWVPLHAGAVRRNDCCALLTAPSGGGKTTLTAALIRRGWLTLGDDKLLLRMGDTGAAEVRALQHHFNLHPCTRGWFPEVGDLERLPVYSSWTEKRKVRIEDIWPGCVCDAGCLTHLVHISQRDDIAGVRVAPLGRGDILSTLLHQTVIPNDRAIAQHVLSVLAATAQRLAGMCLEIGPDAYADPDCVAPLEAALG